MIRIRTHADDTNTVHDRSGRMIGRITPAAEDRDHAGHRYLQCGWRVTDTTGTDYGFCPDWLSAEHLAARLPHHSTMDAE